MTGVDNAYNPFAFGLGYVGSLARPGGNVTGISAFLPELAGKRMEILKAVVPSARRVGVPARLRL